MNLGVFNRVNWKESEHGGMYSEWASLSNVVTTGAGVDSTSVLLKFPTSAGRDVAVSVVRQLASNLGITQAAEPSSLTTDKEVLWSMEVICYGLSLPLSEHDTIRDCVNVYCEWLTSLYPNPRMSVPKPVCEDPNLYARKMISHFHNLFVPRKGEAPDTVNRQAVLCHRVLRTLQQLAHQSVLMDRETWETLLLFLLAINDTLLAPPTVKGDIGDQLCERVLSVLVEVWLLACTHHFPSPPALEDPAGAVHVNLALTHLLSPVTDDVGDQLCERVLSVLVEVWLLACTHHFPSPPALEDPAGAVHVNLALTHLSPVTDDVGDQLCERVLSVLVEVWLLACTHHFPSPPLWKTLRELSMNWRHRVALVEQWNRVNLALTHRLLESMYGPAFPELKILEEDAVLIPPGMTDSCVAQCWFRFLHSIGNPVDLCRPQVISQTHKFLQFALTSDTVVDPCQHPCLNVLPLNFLKAIKGIAGQVDAFLGTQSQSLVWDLGELNERDKKDPLPPTHSPTPPPARRLAKSFSVTPSAVTKGLPKASLIGLTSSRIQTSTHTPLSSGPSSTSSATSMLSLGSEVRSSLAPSRPKCNSILHLFGEWLFEAAQIGTELTKTGLKEGGSKRPSSVMLDHGSLGSNRKTSLSLSQPGSLSEESLDTPSCLNIDRYQAGRAEAIGALCRIFCAKKTGEDILPVYYARFYLTLQQCFRQAEVTRECDECLACIIVNATDLLRLDLDGVQMLVPSIIDALEIILPDKDLKLKSPSISKVELRRASIQLLLSMLALPLHFQNLTIKELTPSQSQDKVPVTFAQLKPRLMNLLINALQVEADPQNTQMLLGGLMLSVLDSALYEERDQVSQPDAVSTDSTSNLLSSDTVSGSSVVDEWDSTNITVGDTELFGITSIHPLNKNSAHALLVRATYLVCHRLISSWKTDLNVSLAALELLAGLARTNIRETDALECKRAVKWLCDYIVYQCWRPPPAHSKDLHSTIVAAFQTAEVWLVTRPSLLDDKETLHTVLEVIELGISGTKSQGKPGEPLKMKDEKELKPVSMRVRDAAESLLTIVLEQVGYFPAACGPESLSCLLDEVLLVKHCNSWRGEPLTLSAAVTKFRYFVVENSTVLALLEEPLGNDQDPQPTITVLIRGGFGRHAWSLQLRHLPRHRSGTKYQHAPNPGRPVPLEEPPPRSHPRHKYFPDSVDRIPQCRADKSIPDLDALLLEDTSGELSELSHLVEAQMRLERGERAPDTPGHGPPLGECAPPPPCQEFQTARLFLSHFGLLSRLDNNQEPGLPPLVALDTSHPSFCQDLEALDNIGSRTTNTCHVFYVRTGQKSADQILNNVLSESTVSPPFLEMLLSLGWVVKVSHHPGWTGHIATSYKLSHNTTEGSAAEETPGGHGGSIFNGDSHVLYWADVSSEIAFVVPTLARRSKHLDQSQQYPAAGWYERSVSEPGDKLRAMSLDSEPSGHRSHVRRHPPTCVMLVWLESFEDHLHFPASDLQAYTATGLESQSGPKSQDCFIIFLHALNSGLLRVKLQGPTGRMSMATPLVDGMVISRRVAGTLVRQTALNICRRRRLDNDSYQPPHVRRRMKVQELVTRYRCEMSQSELLTYLLSGAP